MSHPVFDDLFQTILSRKGADAAESYTASLFAKGRSKIAQKVGEEAVETVIAAMKDDKKELINEISDLFFHTFILMSDTGVTLDDIIIELQKRRMKRDNDRN